MIYHMKRKDKEITDPALIRKILKTTKHITIAMSMNNQPYLVTLSHGYDESQNCIYFHCAKEGRKLDYLKSNNTVWGQAMLDLGYQENQCNHMFATAQFRGKVTLLEKPDEKRQAAECMTRQLNKDPEPMIAKLEPERLATTVFGRIDIEYLSGKKSEEATI